MTEASDYAQEAELLNKWLDAWSKVGSRILNLPVWMQAILLDDINTAILNRVAIMELILNAQRNR